VDIRKRLGQNLRRLRQEKGWSQEHFAFESIFIASISKALSVKGGHIDRLSLGFATSWS